jgi:AcrR family transcriptional regulator
MEALDYHRAMNGRTVDWSALRSGRDEAPAGEGRRDRKKREMRQQLTDTATEMFLDRGFDAVRVSEIAEACDVSEKTVFNYFPTKEALILDLSESTMDALRTDLADSARPPLEAVLGILADELGAWVSWLRAQKNPARTRARWRKFGGLIYTTPSLRAYQSEMNDQLVALATRVLADRAGMGPADPEPQIAAIALLGLWKVQFRAMSVHLDDVSTPEQIQDAVTADVHRAADVLKTGLAGFPDATS